MKNICIITGEPKSINLEIIAKSWFSLNNKIRKKIILIGDYNLIKFELKKINIKLPLNQIKSINEKDKINFLKIIHIPLKTNNYNNLSKKNITKYIASCLNRAHEMATNKLIKGFINCPVDKQNLNYKKLGVTEYLSNKSKNNKIKNMMIFNEKLSVVPITTHIKLSKVAKSLNKKLLKTKLIQLNKSYISLFKKKPKIAVLGLNPHNDENRSSSEESKIIIPVIQNLKNKINIEGPYPADTVFLKNIRIRFDIIVGMYHDQVLAPFKSIYNFDAINITLGLDYLRVSPDHGTGKNIVGKNRANHQSLLKAINFLSNY